MKIIIEKINTRADNFMKACGYAKIENPHKNNEVSYARPIETTRLYPRFHVYLYSTGADEGIDINLHLDMKPTIYQGTTAHSGEYDGAIVENELARIQNLAKQFVANEPLSPSPKSIQPLKKKSFWRSIFSG